MKVTFVWLVLFSILLQVTDSQKQKCRENNLPNSKGTFISKEDCDIVSDALEKLKELQRAEEQAAKNKSKHISGTEKRLFAFLRSSKYVKILGYGARLQLNALGEFRNLTGYTGKNLFEEARRYFGDSVLDTKHLKRGEPDTVYSDTYSSTECQLPNSYTCNRKAKYRTYDGSCNNLIYQNRGRTNRAFARFLPASYSDDLESPRTATDGSDLPSARLVSQKLFESKLGEVSGVHTQLAMVLGQFLDHDITQTPVSKLMQDGVLEDVECGDNGCQTDGQDNTECLPIPVPKEDPDFKDKECLMFVRSQEYMQDNCLIGPREQVNAITSWVDASQVYGSSKEENRHLRDADPKRGKMKTSKNPLNTAAKEYRDFLPTQQDFACRGTNETIQCFRAGDERVNEHIGLTSLHTVWIRMHNIIESELHQVNPKWDGEKLYEESRRILGAIWQNIVYQEYLPVILGPAVMDRYQLWLEKPDQKYFGYNPHINADIHNVFAAAAFRFGHSMIGDFMNLTNQDFDQKESLHFATILFNPYKLYQLHFGETTGVDATILGMLAGRSDSRDRFFSKEISTRLFASEPIHGKGADLPALNLQRARDHGIPGYTKWLEFCGHHVPRNFSDLHDMDDDTKAKLADIYEDVNDIDSFAGGMSERSMEGGIVGPTFGCIIGRQFRNLRNGDSFWFENIKARFTHDQLASIKHFKLSKLFCETLDEVKTIQPYALLQPMDEAAAFLNASPEEMYRYSILYKGNSNKRVMCDKLSNLDYSLWGDGKDAGKNHKKRYGRKLKNPFSC